MIISNNNRVLYNLKQHNNKSENTRKSSCPTPNTTSCTFIEKLKKIGNTFRRITNRQTDNITTKSDCKTETFLSYALKKIKRVFNLSNRKTHSNINEFRQANHFHRQQPITNKQIKLFIDERMAELDVASRGLNDSQYAEQTIDSVLASVYSEQKDAFCTEQIKIKNKIPSSYLQEIGEFAKQNGLKGNEENGIFELSGAGANPFITAVMAPAVKKFPNRTVTRSQETRLRNYAKQKIYDEVTKICLAKKRITPQEFASQLHHIANKYKTDNKQNIT